MPKCEFCNEETEHFRVTSGITYYLCEKHYIPLGELVEYHRNKLEAKKQAKKKKNSGIIMIPHLKQPLDKQAES